MYSVLVRRNKKTGSKLLTIYLLQPVVQANEINELSQEKRHQEPMSQVHHVIEQNKV